ncbi:copper resistance protein CopC [Novosphingobium sp. TH158]|uniref:copper resistance protein CopC n=1 Tax=Novosphingobium sp. TH158 TaxID=2067455 RepID=UPI000C7D242D|nr:copper resistance protein CopC [Novosphingobium sp. TH158]PLK24397.1 hypothetical protein C0V78_14190 [Novosphingobium sp. TH158]
MHSRLIIMASILALATLGLPQAGLARAKVAASTPAAGSTVARPKVLTVTFSEAMQPTATTAAIVMTAMPGMADHGDMPIRNFTSAWSEGNRKLTLSLRQPLWTGTYDIRWQGTGADGMRASGKITFTVK